MLQLFFYSGEMMGSIKSSFYHIVSLKEISELLQKLNASIVFVGFLGAANVIKILQKSGDFSE